MLASPSEKAVWLPAPDPAQSWGRLLPHASGREFLRVSGTAVCLCGGCAAAVLEKSGEQLRLFEPEAAESALSALARDFTSRRVFPERENLRIKTYPACAVSAMKKAGFVRVMLDYVQWKNLRRKRRSLSPARRAPGMEGCGRICSKKRIFLCFLHLLCRMCVIMGDG